MKKTIFLIISLIGCIILSACTNKKNTSLNTQNTNSKKEIVNTVNVDEELWNKYSGPINKISDELITPYLKVITGKEITNIDDFKNTLEDVKSISYIIIDDLSKLEDKISDKLFQESFNLTYDMIKNINNSSESILIALENKNISDFNISLSDYIEAIEPVLTCEYNNKIDIAKNSVFNISDDITDIITYDLTESTKEVLNRYSLLPIDGTIASSNIETDIENTYVCSIKFGTLLDSNVYDNKLVIKTKISPSYSNSATINQNAFNVADIIKNQGAYKFDEIQYWAVSDMTDGSESKVISFTVSKDLINKIKNGTVVDNKVIDYADDVWILPSLRN